MTQRYFALAAYCLLMPGLASAADLEPSQSAAASSSSNPRETDLRALLGEVAAKTHKHFVVDPRVPQTVSLVGLERQSITYPQLVSILQVYGVAVVPGDGILEVIPNADARQAAVPLVAYDNVKTLDDEIITSVIPVKNISAAQLVPILRPMIPQNGHLSALPDRNALVMVDRSANVRRVVEIIKALEGLPKNVDVQPTKGAEKP